MAALRRRLPGERIVYLGDTARLPYGTKSPATVRRYTKRNVDFLLRHGVKGVVVACNTASALALDTLELEVPVWGVVEPGAEVAAARSDGRIGVLATQSTVLSDAYGRALRRLRPEIVVESQACPLFVPLVEEGWYDDPVTEAVARRYLAALLSNGVDTLVLGCTHYPLLADLLQRVAGREVRLVDSAEAVADRVAVDLAKLALEAPRDAPIEHKIFVTDDGQRFRELAASILSDPDIAVDLVEVV